MQIVKYAIYLCVAFLFPLMVFCQNSVKKVVIKDKESRGTTITDEKTPEVEWYKTFGGSYNDEGNCVHQTSDGGYIITGGTHYGVKRPADVMLIKTDTKGNKLWERKFGGSEDDWSNSVLQTTDGGYIITGYTYSYGTAGDGWLIKTDAKGNKQWDKTFGGDDFDWAYSVQQTTDGGYIITGYTQLSGFDQPNSTGGDVWLIKTDVNGNKLWEKIYGGKKDEWGFTVQQTLDGGYIIVGYTESYGAGNFDVWLIKTDSQGNKLWDKTFGGNEDDCCYCVLQTSDGGYIVNGWTESYGAGNSDVWLIKTDSQGNKLWDKTYGGSEQDGGGCIIKQTKDSGYIILGATYSKGAGSRDIWLIKTDDSGNKIWDKTFGGSEKDEGNGIQLTSDGGYIITGWTESYGAGMEDIWLIKLKGKGE